MARKCDLLMYDGVAGACARCGRRLTGRQRRWCSPACERAYQRNHIWSMARTAALQRDGYKCVKCGGDGKGLPKLEKQSPALIRQLGIEVLDGKPVYRIWRNETWVEVNHIDPREGRGYNSGCWNHLSNLEVLCHPCHVDVTALQRKEREGRRVTR